jgi:hypothetical protein
LRVFIFIESTTEKIIKAMEQVIFDTNAYRYLVHEKEWDQVERIIKKLKDKERRNEIETLMSPIVARELLAHVADRSDPNFDKCLKAIKALYLHCGDENSYRMIASPELLISTAFFNATIPSKVTTNEAIGQILFHLAKNPSPYVFRKFQRTLNLNREQVLSNEVNFAIAMWEFKMLCDPKAPGWQIFPNDEQNRRRVLSEIRSDKVAMDIAMGYLLLTHSLLVESGQITPLSLQELYNRATSFLTLFPEPIALYRYVMESMVNSEFNILEDSRGNFVWDIHLMFNVGNHSVAGSKLYFVTSDKAMIRTAVKENGKTTVFTFDEYMEYLGLKGNQEDNDMNVKGNDS